MAIAAFLLVFIIGFTLRLFPSAGFDGIGYDEALYRGYVNELIRTGLGAFPDQAEGYVVRQQSLPAAILPPTRFVYIFAAYLWHQASGAEALDALHDVSCFFSILMLIVSTVFAWRLGGWRIALGVAALMSCSPLQIHMSQHALIDGVFAFWATLCLWLLWENLRKPGNAAWLAAYTAALALLVLTKENAMFAYLGLLGLLGANRWLRFGKITSALLGVTVIGPLLGVVILIFLCGGLGTFIATYHLLVAKASVLPYAIATGDGPWYRYLVDLLLISPLILLLAWAALFQLRATEKAPWYLAVFVGVTYLVMCNVRYGMNLRYATIWDLPLRYLSILSVGHLSGFLANRRAIAVVLAVMSLCVFDLRQYHLFFVQNDLYELVTGGLLRALKILK
ncbi:MAG: phospholipid carrier-dependent glycosyltransferase [Chthoniobacterales bacterium]